MIYSDHFLGLSSESHFKATSNLFWLLAEMLKQATVLSLNELRSSLLITYFSGRAPSRSFLLARTSRGMPARDLLLSNS